MDAMKALFVKLLYDGRVAFFTRTHLDAETIPADWQQYEVSHVKGQPDVPETIQRNVQENFYGTIISPSIIGFSCRCGSVPFNASVTVFEDDIRLLDDILDEYTSELADHLAG